MKKKIILYSCTALLLGACNKGGDSNGSANSWTFGNNTYKAATVLYLNAGPEANLTATATGFTATSANALIFSFLTTPTSNGQMLITNTGDPNTVMVSLTILSGSNTTFYVNDVTNVNANVTVSNGKVSVNFPGKIWLHNMADFNDSAQVSVGTITQQ